MTDIAVGRRRCICPSKGHAVAIVDNFMRRQWDHELGAQTLTPIQPLAERLRVWQELTGKTIESYVGDVTDYDFLAAVIENFAARRGGPFRRTARPRRIR